MVTFGQIQSIHFDKREDEFISCLTSISTLFTYSVLIEKMRAVLIAVAIFAIATVAVECASIQAAVSFADANWNCLDIDCTKRVKDGDSQDVYGCAPFVAHCLAAGNFIDLDPHASMDKYSNFKYNGQEYDLNCCYSKDQSQACYGGPGLADALLAMGWKETKRVKAGTVAIVHGAEGMYSHAVFGVGDNLVDAHNYAHYHVSFDNYQANLLLDPPV
jgi:hypothetical protein